MQEIPIPRFTIGQNVKIREGYGIPLDHSLSPWVITAVTIRDKGQGYRISYSLRAKSATTGYYEEGLEAV